MFFLNALPTFRFDAVNRHFERHRARKKMHKSAEVQAQKDGDIVLGFFMEHVTEGLMDRARAI